VFAVISQIFSQRASPRDSRVVSHERRDTKRKGPPSLVRQANVADALLGGPEMGCAGSSPATPPPSAAKVIAKGVGTAFEFEEKVNDWRRIKDKYVIDQLGTLCAYNSTTEVTYRVGSNWYSATLGRDGALVQVNTATKVKRNIRLVPFSFEYKEYEGCWIQIEDASAVAALTAVLASSQDKHYGIKNLEGVHTSYTARLLNDAGLIMQANDETKKERQVRPSPFGPDGSPYFEYLDGSVGKDSKWKSTGASGARARLFSQPVRTPARTLARAHPLPARAAKALAAKALACLMLITHALTDDSVPSPFPPTPPSSCGAARQRLLWPRGQLLLCGGRNLPCSPRGRRLHRAAQHSDGGRAACAPGSLARARPSTSRASESATATTAATPFFSGTATGPDAVPVSALQ
jgi:hypothetical protein